MSSTWATNVAGVVGGSNLVKNPPIARPDTRPMQVLVRGQDLDSAVADDIRRLVEGFLRQHRSTEHKKAHTTSPPPTEHSDQIQIAIHLGLEGEAQEKLAQQIRDLVQKRLSNEEAEL